MGLYPQDFIAKLFFLNYYGTRIYNKGECMFVTEKLKTFSWVNVGNPDHEDFEKLQNEYKIDEDTISDILDPDEQPRLEVEDDYKVIIGKVNPDRGGVNNASDGKMNVITKVRILKPNEVMTETYLLLATFKDKTQAENCATYYRTKFARLLISLTLSSMNITKDNFQFLPNQDFSKPWSDEELYAKYGLTDDEIAFIESMIRPME